MKKRSLTVIVLLIITMLVSPMHVNAAESRKTKLKKAFIGLEEHTEADLETIAKAVVKKYKAFYNAKFSISPSETTETAGEISFILRTQSGSQANQLFCMVKVDKATGTVTDDALYAPKNPSPWSIYKTLKLSKVSIKRAAVTGIKDKTYTGKKQTQKITVKFGSFTLKKGTDYTVAYKNNKKVGKAKIIIKGKGQFTGKVTKTFKINKKLTAPKIKRWENVSSYMAVQILGILTKVSGADGYEYQYSHVWDDGNGPDELDNKGTIEKTSDGYLTKMGTWSQLYTEPTIHLGFQDSYRLKFKVRSFAGAEGSRIYSKWRIIWLEEQDIKDIVS